MNLFTTLAFCAALSGEAKIEKQQECNQASRLYAQKLQTVTLSQKDRNAIGRTAIAEARNQGEVGISAVIYTIINRLIAKKWGSTITEVVNARHQFEPVHKAKGWHNLPKLSKGESVRINTIINLILDQRLPDPTHGALYFQNAKIVAKREASGTVSKGLTHFGGAHPSAVIKDHTFYASIKKYGKGTALETRTALGTRILTKESTALDAHRPQDQDISLKRIKHQPWNVYTQSHILKIDQNTTWSVFEK